MEVAIPSPRRDFHFNGVRSSPSTPKPFGNYCFSAPTSPSRVSQFYRDFDAWSAAETAGDAVPAAEKPGTPKSQGEFEFEFNVATDDCDTASVAADELFDGGVIKPLKPPPRMQTKRMIFDGESEAAAADRGRERLKSSSRRTARSLSPLRDPPRYQWEAEEPMAPENRTAMAPSSAVAKGGVKKWKLMDFFLFRSASEGRSGEKDPLRKYTAAVRRSNFRAGEGSGSGSGSRRKGRVSAHELHYTVNRAVSEDLKKKTFLPYKQGILGRLAFNPAVHALANGFGFSRK